ncbi:unnamed protein product [Rotaria sp. Silwood1]|nr:unnamed protein product [Rotaria sp. Silwood1]
MDVPACVRFQKCRGLKIFRTTKWDPKESLSYNYGRIYQFSNFRTMIKEIESKQEYNQHKQDHAQVKLFFLNICIYLVLSRDFIEESFKNYP